MVFFVLRPCDAQPRRVPLLLGENETVPAWPFPLSGYLSPHPEEAVDDDDWDYPLLEKVVPG